MGPVSGEGAVERGIESSVTEGMGLGFAPCAARGYAVPGGTG